jgi:hypothetical protein
VPNDTEKANEPMTNDELLAELRRRCELDSRDDPISREQLTAAIWDFIDYANREVLEAVREANDDDYGLLGQERYESLYESTYAAIVPEMIEAIQGLVHPTRPDDVLYAYRTGVRLLLENKVYGPYSTQARMI